MFIPDPGSKNSNKREGWKKIWWHTFLCSHKFHKIVHYFSFEVLKKKICANFKRIIELFAQKIVTKLSKVWVWDPGSGKNLFRIPDPGAKKAPNPGSGSATLVKGYRYPPIIRGDPSYCAVIIIRMYGNLRYQYRFCSRASLTMFGNVVHLTVFPRFWDLADGHVLLQRYSLHASGPPNCQVP